MFGVTPGEEIEPAAEMPERCSITPSDPGTSCADFEFSSVSPDLEPVHETPDYFRRNSRRFEMTPTELFSDNHNDSGSIVEASIELGAIPEVPVIPMGEELVARVAETEHVMVIPMGEELVARVAETEHVECNCCIQLKEQYELLVEEQIEVKRALEEAQLAKEAKSRECSEALASLKNLQMELMQKSMHVGSLAFAVEGSVKEKSRWFLSLGNLSRKFRLLKMEHAKLLEEASQYKKCLADLTQMTNTIISTLDRHVDLERGYKEMKLKFIEEVTERKDIYNKLVELRGNIRVLCRCRPLNQKEIDGGASLAVDFESAKDDEIFVKAPGAPRKVFKFDGVFNPEKDQESVFEKTSPLATSVLDGYNVCIFAYGQTGSGKTFTMEGTEEARGVNYRTLEELFHIIKKRQGLFRYEITMNVLEVYNEHIHDLLLPGSETGGAAKRLEVRQAAEGLHHVPGLVEAHVTNMDEAWEILQTGNKARVVGSTKANEQSSRSHCIHCVTVKGENLMNGESTRSKLWLIDLAGSERVAKTDAQGERLKEAQNINRSLSALGDVISALANKSSHIPFRNSKLTHLLQDSLGGHSKTLMFVQISPNENDVAETLCSLNFASRVRGVELGPAKKQIDQSEISRCRQMVEKAQLDIKNKDGQIKKLEETAHSLELKNKAKELSYKNLQDRIKELETQLIIERKLARQHIDSKLLEHQLEQEQLHQQQLKQQHQEPNTPMNTVSVAQPLTERKHNLATEPPPPPPPTFTELGNIIPPLVQKENRPCPTEGASRPSLIPLSRKVAGTPVSRRNSLIPVLNFREPSLVPNSAIEFSPALPTPRPDMIGGESESKSRGPAKKFSNILRRSLQKKVIVRSPLPQVRRGGGGGVERVRVSTGGSGKKARRVVVGEPGKAVAGQQKRQPVVKERGWNHATTKNKSTF